MDKTLIGYCLKDKDGYQLSIHVCGYVDGKIILQYKTNSDLMTLPRRYKVYNSKNGEYVMLEKKRIYLRYTK